MCAVSSYRGAALHIAFLVWKELREGNKDSRPKGCQEDLRSA
ncbi:hypothetical protein SLEP1_g50545 [Rubroshorea leprosula]|uniref:Uncharacterized protein n=1 Tax=Rubroshorea leprosula TaxID=152421 RepID=A0AAV5M158_9ROSI|nr:hypothetical protein SLEP1_g50545 [Rubroshorea leprosula]